MNYTWYAYIQFGNGSYEKVGFMSRQAAVKHAKENSKNPSVKWIKVVPGYSMITIDWYYKRD